MKRRQILLLLLLAGSVRLTDMSGQSQLTDIPTTTDCFYDRDGDGSLEMFTQGYSRRWWHWTGDTYEVQETLPDDGPAGIAYIGNLNNDGRPELYQSLYNNRNPRKVYVDQGDGTYTTVEAGSLYGLDADNDGLKDLFSYNRSDWSILYQNRDGSFTPTRIDTLSRVATDSLLASRWEQAQGGLVSGDLSMGDWIVSGTQTLQLDFLFTQSIDLNRDGLPDLVGPKNIFYNLGDNRYMASGVSGDLTVRDLNGDGTPDYIFNDTERGRLFVQLYEGGGSFAEQTLMDGLPASGLQAYDFDRDGDVDLLLTFDYKAQFANSFLVYCENDGHGRFTITENAYKTEWRYLYCYDMDNDGRMELLAARPSEGGERNYDLCLFRIEGGQIAEPAEVLVDTDMQKLPLLGDVNNDGLPELITGEESWPGARSLCYTTADLPALRGIPANEAPARPDAPALLPDPATGRLKLSWGKGSDKESSPADLSYALRIGSAPEQGDIWSAEANADGSRRSLRPGNMGTNLDITLQTAKWPQGTYYISLQTVDPMGRGSAWSEEAVYEHSRLSAVFGLSDTDLPAADTLTVTAPATAPDMELRWDWGEGGRLVWEAADRSVCRVVYDAPGDKLLSLTVTDPADGTAASHSRPLSVHRSTLRPHEEPEHFNLLFYWDIDGDGTADAATKDGFYLNDGTGRFEKLGTIFNSNLTLGGEVSGDFGSWYRPSYLLDYDLDGDLDLVTISNKGYVILNNGNRNFSAPAGGEEPFFISHYPSVIADFDNDGDIDSYEEDGSDGNFFVNSGDNVNFEKVTIYGNAPNGTPVDVNGDGYIDFVDGYNECAYINNGDFTFTLQMNPLDSNLEVLVRADFNSDGYLDLACKQNERTIAIYPGQPGLKYGEPRSYVMPLTVDDARAADLDNNGCPDLLVCDETDYMRNYVVYMERDWSVRVEACGEGHSLYLTSDKPMQNDLDLDGTPDLPDIDALLHSRVTNERPQAPRNLRALQQAEGVLLQWDAAADRETPATQMRYNVSLKRKGATGEGAYILSPLNGPTSTSYHDETPGTQNYTVAYRTATRLTVPLDRFEAGEEYELQVQAVDLWNSCSDYSATYTFRVTPQVVLTAEGEVCPGTEAVITYHGTEDLTKAVWDWDGGTLTAQEGNTFRVVWDEPGMKTVRVTTEGADYTLDLLVHTLPDLTFTLPETALAGVPVGFTLPESVAGLSEEAYSFLLSDDDIRLDHRAGSREATATFPAASDTPYWIELQVPGTSCGLQTHRAAITIDADMPVPAIDLVGIDSSTGKNVVTWDGSALPPFVTEVHIYKEQGRTGNFALLGTAAPADGQYVDTGSDPQVSSARYRIGLGTTYGLESTLSTPHSSIHLMINRGPGGAINLMWNAYEGGIVETYRILRGESPDALSEIAALPGTATSYTDTESTAGTRYYALVYDRLTPAAKSRRALRRAAPEAARSNVVCSDDALAVKPAESVAILALEDELRLTPEQPVLHLSAEIMPRTADVRGGNWQITQGEGLAVINQNGLLTATGPDNGTLTVRLTTVDGSNLTAEVRVTKSGFIHRPEEVNITLPADFKGLTPERPSVQLQADVLPANAPQDITWSIVEGSELATLSAEGLLQAEGTENGVIRVRAASTANPAIYDECTIDKNDFITPPESVEIYIRGVDGTSDEDTHLTPGVNFVHLGAAVHPYAAPQGIKWSIAHGWELAELTTDHNGDAFLTPTPMGEGEVIVQVASAANESVYTQMTFHKTGFPGIPTEIHIGCTETGTPQLTPDLSELHLTADVLPANAPQEVTWELVDGKTLAELLPDGTLRSMGTDNGTLLVRATSTVKPAVFADLEIEKNGFCAAPYTVRVVSESDSYVLSPEHGNEVRLTATVLPECNPQEVIWSIVRGEELAEISANGVLRATGTDNGPIIVRAACVAAPKVCGEAGITKEGYTSALEPESVEIQIAEGTGELTPDRPAAQLQATVYPEGASQEVVWEIVSGGDLARLYGEGLLVADGASDGVVRVRVSASDYPQVYAELDVPKHGFEQSGVVSSDWSELRAWVSDEVLFIAGLPTDEVSRLCIMASDGRVVQETPCAPADPLRIDISPLASGVYVLHIECGQQQATFRFLR